MKSRLTVLPHDYDYSELGRETAKNLFGSMHPDRRAYYQERTRFNRECDLQDMAEEIARSLVKSGTHPGIFGSNRFGLLATKGYGEFEEVFMRYMENYLQREHETKVALQRQEKHRDYQRLQKARARERARVASEGEGLSKAS